MYSINILGTRINGFTLSQETSLNNEKKFVRLEEVNFGEVLNIYDLIEDQKLSLQLFLPGLYVIITNKIGLKLFFEALKLFVDGDTLHLNKDTVNNYNINIKVVGTGVLNPRVQRFTSGVQVSNNCYMNFVKFLPAVFLEEEPEPQEVSIP